MSGKSADALAGVGADSPGRSERLDAGGPDGERAAELDATWSPGALPELAEESSGGSAELWSVNLDENTLLGAAMLTFHISF